MDYFGREELRELLAVPVPPAISIYMPTHRTGAEVEAQPLRFRAAVGEAERLLGTDGVAKDVRVVLDELEEMARDREFWRHQADGLAVFACAEMRRVYRLAAALPRLVVVGPTFHTRPLLELLQAPDRFWVLSLSRKRVRLWGGDSARLAPVRLEPGSVPTSLEDALGEPASRPSLGFRSPRGHGSVKPHHGHGAGKDDSRSELERYFRLVDAGVRELLSDEIGPVVLAAVDYYHPMYRSVSRIENLAPEGIHGNVDAWGAERLHAAAWPVARASVEAKLGQALELWESSFGRGKGEVEIATVGRLAAAGRVRLLLTERGRRIWGALDPGTGAIRVVREDGPDPGLDTVELLDELAEMTLRHGGRALVLPSDRMPTTTGLAAVLR